MISRDLMHRVTAADPAPPSAAVDLQRAIWSWKSECEEAAAALGRRDFESLDAALAAREALRSSIAELVGEIHGEGGAHREALATLRRLEEAASAADRRLVDLLQSERARIKSEIDGLGRRTGPTAYDRQEPRHRLNIVR